MSSLGAGLLGFAAGALGGAEQYIQEEREFKRKFTLEDYRISKEKELATFKNEMDLERDRLNADRELQAAGWEHGLKVQENIRASGVVSATDKAQFEAQKDVAKINSEGRSAEEKRATEAALGRTFKLGITAVDAKFGDSLIGSTPDGEYPKTPEEYILALEELGTPEAIAAAEYIYEYLQGVDSWSREDRQQWALDLRDLLKKPAAQTTQPANKSNLRIRSVRPAD